MTTILVPQGRAGHAVHDELRPVLLVCGILSALFYAAMVAFAGMWWAEYHPTSQTISELSVIGAPTRALWVTLGILYTLLVMAFGWGVSLAHPGPHRFTDTWGEDQGGGAALPIYWRDGVAYLEGRRSGKGRRPVHLEGVVRGTKDPVVAGSVVPTPCSAAHAMTATQTPSGWRWGIQTCR